MEWFKFYHNKWLSDLEVISLSLLDRMLFITLLCVTAARDERNGVVVRYHEHRVLTLAHLTPDDYKKGVGFTKRLADAGLIEVINNDTIQIVNFEKRQNSNLTGAERAKRYRHKGSVTEVTQESDERNAREDKIREDKIREKVNDVFDVFWSEYPKKVAKQTAARAYKKISNKKHEQVMEGLRKWKASEQWQKDGGRYIPHPATFINQERYLDEVETLTGPRSERIA